MRKGNLVVAAGVFAASGLLAGCGTETHHDASLSFCTVDQEAKTATIMDATLNKSLLLMKDGTFAGDGALTGTPVLAPGSSVSISTFGDTFTVDLAKKTCSNGNWLRGYDIYTIKP